MPLGLPLVPCCLAVVVLGGGAVVVEGVDAVGLGEPIAQFCPRTLIGGG